MTLNRLTPEQRATFEAIRRSLSRDLPSPTWRNRVPADAHPVTGHCYIATEAAYHAFARELGFVPYVARLEGMEGGTHWWLAHPVSGDIINPTHEQTSKPFDYRNAGVRKPFRPGAGPNRESRRCLELLTRTRARLAAAHAT
jgi:hypothetical protein